MVSQAVRQAYTMVEERFSALEFCRRVRILSGRPYVFDSTILRTLRRYRNECPYKCIDNEKAIYIKLQKN